MKTTKIGIEPKQYEFECVCGFVWIDCENNGCPMCDETNKITVESYESKHPSTFANRTK